ncbi:MAG: hypothetical protein ABH867_01335 [Patescibacteria group bacterium]|nr:hypothetical protein [Patescibacteria group bacterium]
MAGENKSLNFISPIKRRDPAAAPSAALAGEKPAGTSLPKTDLLEDIVIKADDLKATAAADFKNIPSQLGNSAKGGQPASVKEPALKNVPGKAASLVSKAPEQKRGKGKGVRGKSFRRLAVLSFFLFLTAANAVFYFLINKETVRLNRIDRDLFLQEILRKGDFSNQALEKTEILNSVFLEEKGVVDFVAAVDSLSTRMERISLDFKSDQSVKDRGQPYLPFVLEIAGSPVQVQQLVEKLIGSEFIIELIGFSVKSKDSFVNNAEAVIKANLYVSGSFD